MSSTPDTPGWSSPSTSELLSTTRPVVDQLIKERAYDEVISLLETRRSASLGADEPARAAILDTTYQLCLACIQLQKQQKDQKQALLQIAQIENDTRFRIQELLESIWEVESTDVHSHAFERVRPTVDRSFGADLPGVWRRIQNFISQIKPQSELVKETPPELPFESLPPPLVEEPPTDPVGMIDAQPEQIPVTPPPAEDLPPEPALTDRAPAESLAPEPSDHEISLYEPPASELPLSEVVAPEELPSEQLPPATASDRPAVPVESPEPGTPAWPSLVIYLLGPFRAYLNDRPIDQWAGVKAKGLFKYLVATRGRPAPQEVLMDLFWPEANAEAARNNLHVAIYGLRQTLHNVQKGFSHILFRDDRYLLNPDLGVWIDAEDFLANLRRGGETARLDQPDEAIHHYLAAEALYQGDFLEDDRYEQWPQSQRQYLREEYLELLDRLYRHHFEREDCPNSISVCRKMLAVEPAHEAAHRRLIRCYGLLGQRYLAIRQFHQCEEILRRELDIAPSEATINLYRQIR